MKEYPASNYKEYRASRNPYAAKFSELRSGFRPTGFSDAETEVYRGKWRDFFGRPQAKVILELGTYHGETLIDQARKHPQAIHLGVEWKYKACFKGAKKALDARLDNVCFLRANMSRLPWMIAKGEVDRILIFFPDPWSKASHQKWRVLHPGFFASLACLLESGAELLLKTDHLDYFHFIQGALSQVGAFDPMEKARAEELFASIAPTPFEKIFLKQNLPFYSLAMVYNGKRVVPPAPVQDILGFSGN